MLLNIYNDIITIIKYKYELLIVLLSKTKTSGSQPVVGIENLGRT